MSSVKCNFADTYIANATTTTATIWQLFAVSDGYGNQATLATSAAPLKLDYTAYAINVSQASTGVAGVTLRFMIFRDDQSNGTSPPTFADTVVQTYGGTIPAVAAFANFDNDERFTIVHDELIDCNPYSQDGASGSAKSSTSWQGTIDLKNAPRIIMEQGTTQATSGMYYGAIVASNQGSGATALVDTQVATRLWYQFL